ncbi:MAG: thiamine pyrophosphate-binding protein [Sinobacteraceae bacterium]|nr:thiamine pyrophosphate-binding protein [Nevskiaceae bacterium]
MTLTGGMVVSRALGRYGIRTVFAVAGASHTHLLDALDRDGLQIISSRHESGCVSAADGYARITGRLGVALIIADQGTPNAINGIATAFHACSPVLVLIARLPNSWTEAEAEYDNAKHPLVGSISKWSRTVPAAERLAEYVDVAAKRALSGRRGPVVLQIPQEYFAATLADAGAATRPAPQCSRAAADPIAIDEAARLLRGAQRPLLIAGAGACQGGAGEALAHLSSEFGIPIAGNGLGRGVVPEDSQRSFNWPLMQIVAKDADVVCVVGARLKQRLGYGLPPRFSPQAKFIQIDVEAEELSRNRRIDVPIAADAGLATKQLLAALRADVSANASADTSTAIKALAHRGLWVRDALQDRLAYLDALAAEPLPHDAIHPLTLGRTIAEAMPADSVFVGDGADIQNWMYGALRVREAPGFLDHYPMGAMGVGTPLAVGAAAAARELAADGTPCRTVVLTTGDGSFGFYPAELHAAARAGLKLICVVGNDGAWGTELHGQLKAIQRSVNTELGYLRYDKVGEGFGCRGEHVERLAQLRPALERALAHEGPSVINVLIDRNAGAALKTDARVQMILFDDLASNLKTQHSFAG